MSTKHGIQYNYLHSNVIKTIVSTELFNWIKSDIKLHSVKCIGHLKCINIIVKAWCHMFTVCYIELTLVTTCRLWIWHRTTNFIIHTNFIWIYVLIFGVLRHFQQFFSYIMATSFSGGRSRSTRREPPTMGKQLVNFITCGCELSAPFL